MLYLNKLGSELLFLGGLLLGIGTLSKHIYTLSVGAFLMIAVGLSRWFTRLTVRQIQKDGLEMKWLESHHFKKTYVGESLSLELALFNRSQKTVRLLNMKFWHHPHLFLSVKSLPLLLRAGELVTVDIEVKGLRIGRLGIHGLSLVVRPFHGEYESLFEMPLRFVSPYGIEVYPERIFFFSKKFLKIRTHQAGRSHLGGRINEGDDTEFKEIRYWSAGDPLKKMAWKASAKKGKLLVRETERPHQGNVWLALDASVELWAGEPGKSALDFTTKQCAEVAQTFLKQGRKVGLYIYASKLMTSLPLNLGSAQYKRIENALLSCASFVDEDRTHCDTSELARLVYEHLSSLYFLNFSSKLSLARLSEQSELIKLARLAEEFRQNGPFDPVLSYDADPISAKLRHYLASYGIVLPPRLHPECLETELVLFDLLKRIDVEARKQSIAQVHFFGPVPGKRLPMEMMGVSASIKNMDEKTRDSHLKLKYWLGQTKKRKIDIHWWLPSIDLDEDKNGFMVAEAKNLNSYRFSSLRAVKRRVFIWEKRTQEFLNRCQVTVHRAQARNKNDG